MQQCEFVRRKPKNMRTKRIVDNKGPLVNENPKRTLYLHGEKTSDINKEVQRVLLCVQSSAFVTKLREDNKMHPFEGTESLEFLAFKNDASLFCFSSHNKKRPHNIILGRQFNFKLLDMVELGVRDCDQEAHSGINSNLGSKPAMFFVGPEFDFPIFDRVRNLLIDFFGGSPVENLNASGFDRAICVSLVCKTELTSYDIPAESEIISFPENSVVLHITHVALRGSGASMEVVPDSTTKLEFGLRRVKFAPNTAFAKACKQAPTGKGDTNVSRDGLGNVRGQLHVGKQDVSQITKRRFKRVRGGDRQAAEGVAEGGDEAAEGRVRRRKSDGIPNPASDI
eukprot:PhF_6_TR18663/c0_g1_i1/m.27281/K14847/RPF2; ribosome production factor 2